MRDRAKETAVPRPGGSDARGTRLAETVPLALFCAVVGFLAVGVGALAALLVPGGTARAIVWLVVTAVLAVGAGLWWGIAPVVMRRRILSDVAVAARLPPRRHH